MTKLFRPILFIIIIAFSISLLAVTAASAEETDKAAVSLFDYNGKRIGVNTGSLFFRIVLKALPDAKISYYNTSTDLIEALESGKIDGIPGDFTVLSLMEEEHDNLVVLDERMDPFRYGFVLSKTEEGEKLGLELDEWLSNIKASGELDEVLFKWIFGPESEKTVPDYGNFPAVNGTLVMATEGGSAPMNYFRGNEVVGAEIDLAARFCSAYGYGLKIDTMKFDGILPAVKSGKADFAASCITISDERKESVNFSDPYYSDGTVLMVRKEEPDDFVSSGTLPELSDFSDLSGKKVATLIGGPSENIITNKAPDVGKIDYYNSIPDMIQALKTNKVDAFLANNAMVSLLLNRNPDLALFPKKLTESRFGIAFKKGDTRREEWEKALSKIPRSQIEEAFSKWTGSDESIKILPKQDWEGKNGTVRVAIVNTIEPLSYVGDDGELKGFDAEVILMIAKQLDMKVEFTGMELASILAFVQSGKADIGIGSINITPERAQAVDFIPYYPSAFELIVRGVQESQAAEDDSFFGRIRESFVKTFVREGRWKLFLEGIGTTLLITLLSVLFGTALGAFVFSLCRRGNPVANVITSICLFIVRGMPMVVILMVLYFIIFGSVPISGIAVAVIGFTLTFGAAVFGLLKIGVGAIDKGQYEAAYALGYSNHRTFVRIILPQALTFVLPGYKGQVVALLKETAIVGYIAVQDLTKMGDIVRSRTYEAFFPLIAVTVIYFVLEWLIGTLINRLSINIDPKRRKPEKILKGIET